MAMWKINNEVIEPSPYDMNDLAHLYDLADRRLYFEVTKAFRRSLKFSSCLLSLFRETNRTTYTGVDGLVSASPLFHLL